MDQRKKSVKLVVDNSKIINLYNVRLSEQRFLIEDNLAIQKEIARLQKIRGQNAERIIIIERTLSRIKNKFENKKGENNEKRGEDT
jgi:hypothetical protein